MSLKCNNTHVWYSMANLARLNVISSYGNSVELSVLPTLVKLCSDPDMDVRTRAAPVLGMVLCF